MARAIFQNMGGGGGGSSEDCTATKDKVLIGYTAVTSDSNDEPVTGTMPYKHSAQDANSCTLYDGKIYYRIPYGYYPNEFSNSECEVRIAQTQIASAVGLTATKLLAGQSALGVTGTATSDATATANYIYTGKTAYKNGQKITGTMTVSSILSFDYAAYSTTQIMVKWQNPSKGPFSGVVICAKTGGYPTTPDDNRKYTGYGDNTNANGWSSTIIGGLTSGTTYYIRIWSYCTCSAGDMFSDYKQATCKTTASGRKTFTSSGTWTVPTGVTSINIHCTGGGASGASGDRSSNSSVTSGGGGGGGYCSYKTNVAVTPGEILTITVGSGGIHANNDNSPCVAGNLSSVYRGGTAICIGNGGSAGRSNRSGSNGGSGGGAGANLYGFDVELAGSGGSNGSDGEGFGNTLYIGKGQGTSTREFGASNGTLYSGGGGGGAARNWNSGSDTEEFSPAGSGGAGGGASGGAERGQGANGSAGTGGGGGGGGASFIGEGWASGGDGGSGNVIITW